MLRVKEDVMTFQEAIRILMLSPVYFKLEPAERYRLIKEYCESYDEISSSITAASDTDQ